MYKTDLSIFGRQPCLVLDLVGVCFSQRSTMISCLPGFKRLRRFWCRSGSYDVAEDEPKATRITFKKEYTLEEHEQEGATGEGHQTQTRDRPTPFDRSQNQPVSQPKLNTKEEGVIDSKQTLNDRHLKEEQLRRENEKKDSEDEIKDLKQENRKLEREKEEALLRLSELVSLKLRDNNPDIVDLSDAYRPTKLAEMFSELYDNEWTAAFIVMEENGFKDRQTIDFLLDVLMESFIFCRQKLDDNWQLINQ
ncbi:uncharacterized protein LOC128226815 [Mya arenaria]|uniref:uncharacterized protein LOC128226815 n=1 Tax=Mya arenaria TaxID=6604 RepID=UPI0022E53E07|nr:uncharacterized protein LOC128226815 [Mya arenaria]